MVLRPRLLINGRRTNSTLLKNTSVTIFMNDFLGNETKIQNDDLTFENYEEKVVNFQVPSNVTEVRVTFKTDVFNATTRKNQTFHANEHFDI